MVAYNNKCQFLGFRGGPDEDAGFFMDLVVDVVVAVVVILVSSSAILRLNLVFSVLSFAISCVRDNIIFVPC